MAPVRTALQAEKRLKSSCKSSSASPSPLAGSARRKFRLNSLCSPRATAQFAAQPPAPRPPGPWPRARRPTSLSGPTSTAASPMPAMCDAVRRHPDRWPRAVRGALPAGALRRRLLRHEARERARVRALPGGGARGPRPPSPLHARGAQRRRLEATPCGGRCTRTRRRRRTAWTPIECAWKQGHWAVADFLLSRTGVLPRPDAAVRPGGVARRRHPGRSGAVFDEIDPLSADGCTDEDDTRRKDLPARRRRLRVAT